MSIQAITFDIGGTLIEPWPSVGRVYAEVATHFGVRDLVPDHLTESFMRAWQARTGFDYSHESWFDIVRQTFGEVAPLLPAEYYPAVYERFAKADAWRIYDDVIPALETLTRRGFKLGVVSNWDERLRPLLTQLGLAAYFSSIVISCEAGAEKPSPHVFRLAAEELGVTPDELLHIGDSYAKDILGARKIGATGIQVMRSGVADKSWQIHSLHELDVLLQVTGRQKQRQTVAISLPGPLLENIQARARPAEGGHFESTHNLQTNHEYTSNPPK